MNQRQAIASKKSTFAIDFTPTRPAEHGEAVTPAMHHYGTGFHDQCTTTAETIQASRDIKYHSFTMTRERLQPPQRNNDRQPI